MNRKKRIYNFSFRLRYVLVKLRQLFRPRIAGAIAKIQQVLPAFRPLVAIAADLFGGVRFSESQPFAAAQTCLTDPHRVHYFQDGTELAESVGQDARRFNAG
jgi:hypothetical protein